jgi:hypothetical protein
MAEHTQAMVEYRWMATDSYRRDSERTLIIQNMFVGDVGGAELCQR